MKILKILIILCHYNIYIRIISISYFEFYIDSYNLYKFLLDTIYKFYKSYIIEITIIIFYRISIINR